MHCHLTVAFILSLALVVDAGKGSKGPRKQCFDGDVLQATAYGSALLATFWFDITSTDCSDEALAAVFKDHYAKDVTVPALGLENREQLIAAFIDSGPIPSLCTSAKFYWKPTTTKIYTSSKKAGLMLWKGWEFNGLGKQNIGYLIDCYTGLIKSIDLSKVV